MNKNYMRDLMLTGFELSRISGVPMLYLGNPGMGKTTIVSLWAKRNGYHVESLIGSAFDRSEILGYMVKSYFETYSEKKNELVKIGYDRFSSPKSSPIDDSDEPESFLVNDEIVEDNEN